MYTHQVLQGNGKDSLQQARCLKSFLYLRFLGFFLSFEQNAWLTRANECLLNEIKDRLPILKEQDRKNTVLVVVKPKRNYLSTCTYPLFECIWKHRLGLTFASSTLSPVRGYAQDATETPSQTPSPSWCTSTLAAGMLGTYSSQLSLAD